jgi:hypothetical protein
VLSELNEDSSYFDDVRLVFNVRGNKSLFSRHPKDESHGQSFTIVWGLTAQ